MTGPIDLDLWYDPSAVDIARDLADMLRAAGAAPSLCGTSGPPRDADGLIVLLGPSPRARCWVDQDWLDLVFNPVMARGCPVFPVRIDDCDIPEQMSKQSFADFFNRDRDSEAARLLQSLARAFGPERIRAPDSPDDIPTSPPRAPIRLRYGVGYESSLGADLYEENLPLMQDGLFYELGVPFPETEVCVDPSLPARAFAIDLFDTEEWVETIPDNRVFVNARPDELAQGGIVSLAGQNPASGHQGAWVDQNLADPLMSKGLTVWDARGRIVLCLSALIRNRSSAFLNQPTVSAMLAALRTVFPLLVDTTVPDRISPAVLTDVLRRLAFESVPVRNLRRILIEIAQITAYESRPHIIVEELRSALRDVITHRFSRGQDHVVVALLDPVIEAQLEEALVYGATSSWIELESTEVAPILEGLESLMSALGPGVQPPAVLTIREIRAPVRRLIALRHPTIHVISYHDLDPDITIQPVGRIGPEGITLRSGVDVKAHDL